MFWSFPVGIKSKGWLYSILKLLMFLNNLILAKKTLNNFQISKSIISIIAGLNLIKFIKTIEISTKYLYLEFQADWIIFE